MEKFDLFIATCCIIVTIVVCSAAEVLSFERIMKNTFPHNSRSVEVRIDGRYK